MTRRTLVLLVLIVAMFAVAAAPAAAQRGGPKGPRGDSTITLDQPQPVHYGDTVTFTVQTTKTDRPFVLVECSKGGVLVYSNTVGMFQDWYDEWGEPDSVLASLAWNGGDADCVAQLRYQDRKWRMRTLATMEFHVYAA